MKSTYASNDKKRILTGLGIIFMAVLLIYKLPHRPYSIIEYIIKPMEIKGSIVNISGLIPIVLIVVATNVLSKVEKLKKVNSSIIFLVILVLVMPVMNWTIELARTGYYSFKGEGVSSVEIVDTRPVLGIEDHRATIDVNINLKDYSMDGSKVRVRICFPEELAEIINKKSYESGTVHNTFGSRKVREVREVIAFELENEEIKDKLLDYWRSGVKLEYELY